MSLRNVRKIYGNSNTLPPLEGTSDEEFEPLYAKGKKSSKCTYEGLEISSHSESELEVPDPTEDIACAVEKPKAKKKKNKKNRRTKRETIPTSGMDEIDKSVMEVNALLGTPPPASTSAALVKKVDQRKLLLSVQSKYLDYNNELKRIFGSESLDERGKRYRPHNVIKYRRAAIVPTPENKRYHSVGLAMSLHHRDSGLSYFTFDHNREYQRMHQTFMAALGREDVVPLDESRRNTHIEGLLESADFMFRAEEFTSANNMLESIISYLHYIAHPSFNLTDQTVRLEYRYMENRPFFIAVFKYMYMLTNKACHRTALELAKLLLNLDPSDPLAVIFVIDVIALRAREHQWLVDVIEFWRTDRDAGFLFNILYSEALAHFHVAIKNKTGDFTHANELLCHAMLLYPTVATRIFENCKHDASLKIRNHPYFDVAQDSKLPPMIRTSMTLHAKLVCWRWREPAVMDWFFDNALVLVEKLDNDPEIQDRANKLSQHRQHLLAGCPDELVRHLHVVRAMSNLLVEWELPSMPRERAWDPLTPLDNINRYGYGWDVLFLNLRFAGNQRPHLFMRQPDEEPSTDEEEEEKVRDEARIVRRRFNFIRSLIRRNNLILNGNYNPDLNDIELSDSSDSDDN